MTGRARHRVPFYIAAPTQTLDPSMPDGTRIPIEERAAEELTHFQGRQVAAPGIEVRARRVPWAKCNPRTLSGMPVSRTGNHSGTDSSSVSQV